MTQALYASGLLLPILIKILFFSVVLDKKRDEKQSSGSSEGRISPVTFREFEIWSWCYVKLYPCSRLLGVKSGVSASRQTSLRQRDNLEDLGDCKNGELIAFGFMH